MFSHFTNNETALDYAKEIADIYSTVAQDDHYTSQADELKGTIDRIRAQIPVSRAAFHCPFADADIMIPDMIEGVTSAVCPVCGVTHEVPHDDAGRKRIWHRNRNMFMPAK